MNLRIPWNMSIHCGNKRETPNTEQLRQQAQLHPEEAHIRFDLGLRLLNDNHRLERQHTKFQQEWTQDTIDQWHQYHEEAIHELEEAIRLFQNASSLSARQENIQARAIAHFWLGDCLLRRGLPIQARTEWENCLKIATGELADSAHRKLIWLDKDKETLLRPAEAR